MNSNQINKDLQADKPVEEPKAPEADIADVINKVTPPDSPKKKKKKPGIGRNASQRRNDDIKSGKLLVVEADAFLNHLDKVARGTVLGGPFVAGDVLSKCLNITADEGRLMLSLHVATY